MLFAINEGDQRMIKIFFDWVSDIVSRPEELARLTERCSYEEFTELGYGMNRRAADRE